MEINKTVVGACILILMLFIYFMMPKNKGKPACTDNNMKKEIDQLIDKINEV